MKIAHYGLVLLMYIRVNFLKVLNNGLQYSQPQHKLRLNLYLLVDIIVGNRKNVIIYSPIYSFGHPQLIKIYP